jgi:hypothetical protein
MEENNQPHHQTIPEQRHTQNTDGYASSSNGPTTHTTRSNHTQYLAQTRSYR